MHLLVLSEATGDGKDVLPALEFLDHTIAMAAFGQERQGLADADVVLVDARADLARASQSCRTLAAGDYGVPILVVVGDGGLAALKTSWGFDDWVLPGANPAEVETRIRLLVESRRSHGGGRVATVGDLSIDEDTYVVRLRGVPLDLTYREFELLKYLAQNPGRVFTRSHLLQEVWGYDYFGGTRTVDVHIRRLRAKLGAEREGMIGTVRGVGYKLDPEGVGEGGVGEEASSSA